MERVWIDSFDISFKSAFRNLKSAILLGVMLLALSVPSVDAQQPMKVPRIGFLSALGTPRGVQAGFARTWVHGGEKHCH